MAGRPHLRARRTVIVMRAARGIGLAGGSHLGWAGELAPGDEFLARTPEVRLRTFAWTNVPGGYLVKP
jgi:hypothetical protein